MVHRKSYNLFHLQNIPKLLEITKAVVDAVNIPVTVKTRLGWSDEMKNIEEIALRLQDVGIAALTIHGRTRCQLYKGEADWTLIGKVKNNPLIKIPIIGNGDVDSGEKALEYLYAGANAVEVGGAALYDPTAPIRVARELEELLDARPELTEKLAKGDTWR